MNRVVSLLPKVAVLVLAAGLSERMGEKNKLLLLVRGQALLAHALHAATNCDAQSVHVLTGFERDRSMALAQGMALTEIYNPEFCQGQDKSLAVGLAALQHLHCSVLVLLADQPDINGELLNVLIQAHREDGGQRALIPVFGKDWGTPRILPAALVQQAAEGAGDFSLRSALASGAVESQLFEVEDPAVLLDIDTPEEYLQLTQQNKPA